MPGRRKRLDPKTIDATPFAFKKVTDPITGEYVIKRIVSPQITDEIMSTGNATVLEKFYNDNETTLTAADKKYLKAKLSTAKKIEKIRKKQLTELSKGNDPYSTRMVDNTEIKVINQYHTTINPISCSLPDIKMSQKQTSNNGCWSYAMSLMLKSKGIDLSQEEIRAFRPNYKPDSTVKKLNNMKLLNAEMDDINNVYENSDIILETLPNHFMQQYSFSPFGKDRKYTHNQLEVLKSMKDNSPEDMKKYINADKKLQDDVRKDYLSRTKKKVEDIIFDTIIKEKTPVVMNLGNSHYVTITGYNKNTGVLNIVDSQQKAGKTSVTRNINELLEEYIAPKNGVGRYISFTTLKRIPVPAYQNRTTGLNEYIEFGGNTKFGSIKGSKVNPDFAATYGQVEGKAKNNFETYNYRNVYPSVSNPDLTVTPVIEAGENEEQAKAEPIMCTVDTYFPKKVIFKQDEKINTPEKIKNIFEEERNEIYTQLENAQNNVQNNAVNNAGNVNNPANPGEEAGDAAPVLLENPAAPELNVAPNLGEEVAPAFILDIPEGGPVQPGSFGEFIKTCKDQINRQKEDRFKAISSLYAVYKYIEKNQIDTKTLGTTQMTAQAKDELTREVKKYNPLISSYHGEKDMINTKDLNYIAVKGTPAELYSCISKYCQRVVPTSFPDITDEKKNERNNDINTALNDMVNTGTGVNYFGSRRSSNSTKYNNMIRAIQAYQQKPEKDPFETFNLKKQCLSYISDKYTVRSSPSGKIRFDNTMKILKNIMCPREFSTLVNDINKKRGLVGQADHPDYITVTQYDAHPINPVNRTTTQPESIDVLGFLNGGKMSGQDVVNTLAVLTEVDKGEREIKDIMGVLLAVHEITKGKLNETVIDPAQPGLKFEQFRNKVNAIKSDRNPAFEKLLKDNFDIKVDNSSIRVFDSQKANGFINDSGSNLAQNYNQAKKQMNAHKKAL